MADVQNTDTFLVNRSQTSYQVEAQNLMADLQDTDLMLVNRAGTSYKVTGAELKDSLQPELPPVIGSVSLVESDPDNNIRFTDQEFVASTLMTLEGEPVSTKTFDAYVEGNILNTPITSAITNIGTASSGWTPKDAPGGGSNMALSAVAYGDGTWVATATNPSKADNTLNIIHSTDGGDTWGPTVPAENSYYNWRDVAYGDNKFVAVGTTYSDSQTAPVYSTDGITWFKGNQAAKSGAVLYGDNGWIAVPYTNDDVLTSTDGITWTTDFAVKGTVFGINGVYANGVYMFASGSKEIYTATQPSGPWTLKTPYNSGNIVDVAYGDGVHIAIYQSENKVLRSTDNGETWTSVIIPSNNWWTSVAYLNGIWSIVCSTDYSGNLATVYSSIYSIDGGLTWTGEPTTTPSRTWAAIGASDSEFVAVSSTGDDTGKIIVAERFGNTSLLTFNDDTDLALFETSDAVKQIDSAASGFASVIDVTAKTMFVAASTGTWATGQTVVGPSKVVENAKKYLKFDATGAVSDLLSAPQTPAYTTTDTNPGLTFKFPATFPSGNAPDEELGNGTTITVSVTAENSIGISVPVTATVQPVDDSSYTATAEPPVARSLTAEEMEEQKLRFLTYDNRKEVYIGSQAQAKRDALRTILEAQGYTTAEINEMYD